MLSAPGDARHARCAAYELRRQNFEAYTAVESGLLGVSDEQQLAFAASHGRVLLTHNRDDFIQLDVAWRESNRPHAGLLLAQMQPPQDVARRVARILDSLSADELENLLLFV